MINDKLGLSNGTFEQLSALIWTCFLVHSVDKVSLCSFGSVVFRDYDFISDILLSCDSLLFT